MNTLSHRLIFNRVRGCLMAVAETACSQGKGGDKSRSNRVRGKCSKSKHQQVTRLQGALCFDRGLAVPASHIPLGLERIACNPIPDKPYSEPQ